MPDSVWDNIYKGIKDFAGDDNKANALIGGGIGAGVGGLIDGWRGAGIGAFGGGIAGYKSNDIKNWWNTPTDQLKDTPPKVEESTKQVSTAVTPPAEKTPTKDEYITNNLKVKYSDIDSGTNLYDKIAKGLLADNLSYEELNGMDDKARADFFARHQIQADNNRFTDTEATDISQNKLGTHQDAIARSLDKIQKAFKAKEYSERRRLEEEWNNKYDPETAYDNKIIDKNQQIKLNNLQEYNKAHPDNTITSKDYQKVIDWKQQQQLPDTEKYEMETNIRRIGKALMRSIDNKEHIDPSVRRAYENARREPTLENYRVLLDLFKKSDLNQNPVD